MHTTYITDDNGNMDVNNNPLTGVNRTFVYDVNNMPVAIKDNNQVVINMEYDGNRARVRKYSPSGAETLYVNSLYECDQSGACTSYIFAGGTRIARKEGGTIFYIHQDHQGSTRVVTNAAGTNVEDIEYSPYGYITKDTQTGPYAEGYKFTSQLHDTETGLHYYNARYYDPYIGRFITADSIVPDPGNPQSFNRYAYVINNPVNLIDLSGHSFCEWWSEHVEPLDPFAQVQRGLKWVDDQIEDRVGDSVNASGNVSAGGDGQVSGELGPPDGGRRPNTIHVTNDVHGNFMAIQDPNVDRLLLYTTLYRNDLIQYSYRNYGNPNKFSISNPFEMLARLHPINYLEADLTTRQEVIVNLAAIAGAGLGSIHSPVMSATVGGVAAFGTAMWLGGDWDDQRNAAYNAFWGGLLGTHLGGLYNMTASSWAQVYVRNAVTSGTVDALMSFMTPVFGRENAR